MNYEFERSRDFLCVPACINMILRRRGLTAFDQLELAVELGLVVPSERAADFPGARVSDEEQEWGVHPQQPQYSLRGFLLRQEMPLEHKFIHWREVPSSAHIDFVVSHLDAGNDVIVGFDYKVVFSAGGHSGHVSLVLSSNPMTETMELLDPASASGTSTIVPLPHLIRGMAGKQDGYWLFGQEGSIDGVEPPI